MQCFNVLALIGCDIAQNSNSILPDFFLFCVESVDDALKGSFVIGYGGDSFILFVVREFIQSLEDNLMPALDMFHDGFEGDFLVKDVVDEDPQLPWVIFDNPDNIWLFSDDLVACSHDCHLADIG